jgi:D-glycero-alpha-D-manno-heptose-7-phosphate kinase
LKYSKSELVDNIDQIQHKIIRQVLKDYEINGIDFNSSADIPAGTGLGSSSAFTVGLINLCNAYTWKYMNKEEIANLACEIEINKLGEPIGKQDQYICAIGGLNYISFHQDDSVTVEKVYIDYAKRTYLEKNLLMFYTGVTRSASEILIEQKNNTSMDRSKIENLHKMVQLAGELKKELLKGNINAMGEALHAGWMYKRELASGISSEQIDYYYDLAMKNGATGGKLLGAGGGGFLLFYVKEYYQEKVRKALKDLKELEFHFDHTGTSIIYYD